MKKMFSTVMSILMLISVLALPISATDGILTDSKTGLQYKYVYDLGLSSGESKIISTGATKDVYRPNIAIWYDKAIGYNDPNPDLELNKYKAEIEKCKKELTAWAENLDVPGAVQSDWILYNGEKAMFTKESDGILRLFGLNGNFKGTKEITKNGVPFVVTGDGAGNFKVGVSDSVVGRKTVVFNIPAARDYKIHENKTERFEFWYKPLSDNSSQSWEKYYAKSVSEGFDFCAKNADPAKIITVTDEMDTKLWATGTLGDEYIINVVYGNDAGKTPAPSNPQSGDKTKPNGSGTTPVSDEKSDVPSEKITDVQNNGNPTNEQTDVANADKTSEEVINSDTSAENTNKIKPEEESRTGLYIGIAVAVVVIAVGTGTAFILLKKKNKK